MKATLLVGAPGARLLVRASGARLMGRRWLVSTFLIVGSLTTVGGLSVRAEETSPTGQASPADSEAAPKAESPSKPATSAKSDESAGQADLDEAVSAKLGASDLEDLTEVVKLCDRALEKGLDAENADFCKKLLASTLVERARAVTTAIFSGGQPDPRWPQMRALALADVDRALKLDPDQPQAYLVSVRLQALPGGDRKRLHESLDEAIRRSADDAATKFEALMLRASIDDSIDKKLADYAAAHDTRPEEPAPLRSRGLIYLQQNRQELALADFDAALKLDPEHPQTHEARGLALTALKRLDEARACFARAAELAPKQIGVWLQKGQVDLLTENYNAAIESATKALELDPENVGANLLHCEALTRAGRIDEALAEADDLVKRHPNQPIALRARALVNAAAGKFEAATEDLEQIVRKEPRDLDTQLQLSLLYRSQKKTARAIEVLDSAIAIDPARWQLRYARADAQLTLGKHKEALADYNEAVKQAPRDSGLLNNLAWLLCTSPDDEVRDGKRAIVLAKLACEVTDYKQPNLLSTLGAAYAETGDLATAKEWVHKALALADDKTRETLQTELATYESGRPMREKLVDDQPTAVSAEKPTDEIGR
jgi:tetratricopeptide (TPR) repeat protein